LGENHADVRLFDHLLGCDDEAGRPSTCAVLRLGAELVAAIIVIGNFCGDSRVAIFLEKQKKRERETSVNAKARHSEIDLQTIPIILIFRE